MSSNTAPEGFVPEAERMLATDSVPEALSCECDISDSSCDCPPGDEQDEEWIDTQVIQSIREEFPDGVFDEEMTTGTSYVAVSFLRVYCEDDDTYGLDEYEISFFLSDQDAEELSDELYESFVFEDEEEEEE